LKTLSEAEIESLLGIRKTADHPLDVLGYGFTTEGQKRFHSEHPNFYPQIAEYVKTVLRREGVFPSDTDVANPGLRTFIRADGSMFRISTLEETGLSRYERITSRALSEREAIREYVRQVANPDYIAIRD
jgi:hypothetical protein